jgi:hypothetical protein
MLTLVRKIHIYTGLLVFVQLVIYGAAGIVATFEPFERPKIVHDTKDVRFAAPPSATDKEVAVLVYRDLRLPMNRPIPDWFLRRTPDHHLLLDFYNINGIYRVVVLEDQQRLRIARIHNSTWLFLSDIHAATLADREAPRLVRIWAAWNEVGIWALLAFCVSGVWLWLGTRPRFYWAWATASAGALALAALWRAFR